MSFLSEYYNIPDESNHEEQVLCPFPHKLHNGVKYFEEHPSAHVNTEKRVFHCKACGRGLSQVQFIKELYGCDLDFAQYLEAEFDSAALTTVYNWEDQTSLSPESLQTAKAFKISPDILEELHVKTPTTSMSGLAFPVILNGAILDVREYVPNRTPKCTSRKGKKTGLIVPASALDNRRKVLLVCAGEKDMAVARSHGFNAITITGGEQTLPKCKNLFKGHNVIICYDNDETGKTSAYKLANYLKDVCKVGINTEFHRVCKENKEDITDFFVKYGKTREDLIAFLKMTKSFSEIKKEIYPKAKLDEVIKKPEMGFVKTSIQVVSVSEEAYLCPCEVTAKKSNDATFSVNATMIPGEARVWKLTDDTLADMLHVMDNNFTEDKILTNLKALMHIPANEKGVQVAINKSITVYKASVTDMYETSNEVTSQPTEILTYSLDGKLESGQKKTIVHKMIPHPYKGGQLISICTSIEDANDSVSNFEITEQVKDQLKLFHDIGGSVKEKMNRLAEMNKAFLGYNGYNTLITCIDLAFNSALSFNLGPFKEVKGCLDTFVISESRIGKSSTCEALRKLYGLGTITSLAGNSATIPGLIGGSNKTPTGFQTRAGVIPQNHRGLVIFEEFGKSDKKISSELTEIRSSSEVRIARVSGSIMMPAMLRMITLTNPKTINGQIKSIASYPNGFSVLTDLVETAEDIARYDMVVILADRGNREIDPFWEPETPLPEEAYRARIRWIWSRSSAQISIPKETKECVVTLSNQLNREYDCHIKLFGTECWKKLIRIAIATAGMLVSTDNTFETIIVKPEHVEYAADLLKTLYDNPTFKLREYVENEKRLTEIDEDGVAALQNIYDMAPTMIMHLEQTSTTSRNVLQSVAGLSSDDLSKQLNQLTKALFVRYSGYDIIPTERFRKGLALINRKTHVEKLGKC